MLYDPDIWDTRNNDIALGAAIVSDNYRFGISKANKPNKPWSIKLDGVDVDGLDNYEHSYEDPTDFDGEKNTDIIISITGNEDNAAYYCHGQTIYIEGRGSVNCYLPSAGEIRIAKKNDPNNVLSLINGIVIPYDYIWTSTERSAFYATYFRWRTNDFVFGSKDNDEYIACPFFSLI